MSSATPSPSDEPVSVTLERELVRPTLVRRVQWRLEAWAFIGFEALLGVLSAGAMARVGRVLGAAAHRISPERRQAVGRNLRIAFAGEKTAAELVELEKEVFKRAGANLLSALRMANMSEAELAGTVQMVNGEYMREAMSGGRGLVMVLAHMGNWEVLAQWSPSVMPPGKLAANMYRPLNNQILNARVLRIRATRGLKLFSKDESPLAMAALVRDGGCFGVLCDQRVGRAGELVPFFGRITSCTPLPSMLARRTGAAVLGASLRTLGPGRWELKIHKLEGEPTTANMMELLERIMRESPADVFWMQDRWRMDRRAPQHVVGRVAKAAAPGADAPVATKRRRALLWADAAGVVPARPVAEPADVDYEAALPDGAAAPLDVTRIWIREAAGEETTRAFLLRVDGGAILPLDYVVAGARYEAELRETCGQLGLGWVAEKPAA
jgi:KDO2-lipid IV(A) lauroyltransferase